MNAHKSSSRTFAFAVAVSAIILVLAVPPAESAVITDADIKPIPAHVIHAGNGKLNLILFNFGQGGGVNNNELKDGKVLIFNGDDANTNMPVGTGNSQGQGQGNQNNWASESYITSIGDLRDFYKAYFPDVLDGSTITEIVLFVDLCETGQGQGNNTNDYITLNTLDIVVDYDPFSGSDTRNNPRANDLSSATQNITESGFTGGDMIAKLDPAITSKKLPVTAHGSGWADVLIFTGINPFDAAFTDDTPILFFWESSDHEGGGTDIFISGTHAPEPGTMVLLGLGGLGLLARRRRRRS